MSQLKDSHDSTKPAADSEASQTQAGPNGAASQNPGEGFLDRVIDGKYRIQEIIGRGGMGLVYKAEHTLMHRVVAMKILHAHLIENEDSLRRFQHEARVASKLNHPNAVTIYDFGIFEGRPYLVMEYCPGETLKERIRTRGPIAAEEINKTFGQVCEALIEAHSLGIIHRDLKPDNIIVREKEDGSEVVEVLDFGIAKLLHESGEKGATIVTQQGMFFGTPHYASPEQVLSKELDARSDIYSLGVILYEALTGTVPFDAPSMMEILLKHLNAPVEPIHERYKQRIYPKHLEEIVHKCLAKDPTNRYQSVKELLSDLRSLGSGNSKPKSSSVVSHAGPALAVLGSIIAVVVGVWYFLLSDGSTNSQVANTGPVSHEETSTETRPLEVPVPPESRNEAPVSEADNAIPSQIPGTDLVTNSTDAPVEAPQIDSPDVAPESQSSTSNIEPPTETTTEPTNVATMETSTPPNVSDSLSTSANDLASAPKLSIVTKPAGASVTVNNIERGVTPLNIEDVAAGDFEVVIKKDGFEDYTTTVALQNGEFRTLDITLSSKKAGVTPAQAQEFYRQGDKLYKQRRYKEAAEFLAKAVEGNPGNVKARLSLGICYLRTNRRNQALDQFLEAAKVDRFYAPTFFNLACYYSLVGDKETSLRSLKRTIELEPAAKRWAQNEPDLSNIRGTDEFKRLVQ